MDWNFPNGGAPSSVLIPLGTSYNNEYYLNEQCSTNLEELVTQLQADDPKNHSRRLGLGFIDIINKDLKPMLISCYENEHAIFRSAVKLLVGITTPIRCLTFVETSSQRIHASDVICQLRQLLYRAKESFLDARSTRAIIAHVEILLEHPPLTPEKTESVNFCLALLRNVLHIPERPSISHPQMLLSQSLIDHTTFNNQQNQILCNLFAQGLGPLLLKLLDCPQRDEWVGTVTQVISVLFKGRSAESIRNRLGTVMEASESSEEEDKSSVVTDNIDTLRNMTLSSSNSSATSSKRHKKETKFHQKKRRIEVQLTPTEEVSKLLKNFVVDFMPKGYNALVGGLHQQSLKHDLDLPLDQAQFFWLIAYFLGFAPILKLDIRHFKNALDIEILSYLTWGVVRETETLDRNSLRLVKKESSVRRLHRGVTAIREFLQMLKIYSHTDSDESRGFEEWSRLLHSYLPEMRDLRQTFLLLLRQFNPSFQDRQYLCDVITTNHLLMLTLSRAAEFPAYGGSCFDLKEHLKQFCTPLIVARYGVVLEDFRTNDPVVNNSIFTFLQHVNVDLGRIDLLLDPVIVCPFGKIREEKFHVDKDWRGLIECVLQTFGRSQPNLYHQYSIAMNELWHPESPTPTETIRSDHLPVFRQLETNIETLLCQLRDSGFHRQLDWIQSSLLKTCAAHLGTYDGRNFYNPIACLNLKKKVSCPIVPWTEVESTGLRSNRFFCLLQLLGLLPVFSEGGFYPCIPHNWSPKDMFKVALNFGPIDQTMVDFDIFLVKNFTTEQTHPCSLPRKSTAHYLSDSLQQATQVNIENEGFLTRTPSPPHVSSQVLDWVMNQPATVRGSKPKGNETDETTLSDSE